MSAKTYELMFEIAGTMNQKFAAVFKKAANLTKIAEERVDSLNRASSQMKGLVRQAKAVDNLSDTYKRQRQALQGLQAAILKTKTPSTVMLGTAEKLARETENTKKRLDAETRSLQKLKKELYATGMSTDQLLKKQSELAQRASRYSKVVQLNLKQQNIRNKQEKLRDNGMASMFALSTIGSEVSRWASAPVKQAMQMEDAMAEIKKVVDFSSPDGLQKMQEALEKMSLTIPMTADGLAKITAAAGQAGIAESDLIRFTETAAKMGVAFDISAEEAGEMMAKWRSGMNLTQAEVESLADATNALSNNNAAMAKQVGEALKRYGALGKVAGLTEKQTAAMAATIIGAGAEAEVAATGMNAFMRALTKGGSMTDLQKAAFGNVGFDALQLQKDVQKDAPKAIFAVLEAVKTKLPKELQMQYLTAMFGEEGARAMGPMLANTEKLRENFELVANSEKFAGSMLNEFKSRSETTSNAFQLASNAFTYFTRAIGTPLLGPMKEAALEFVKFGEAVGDWIKKNQGTVTVILKVSGALLGLVAGFHIARVAAFLLLSPLKSLSLAFISLRKAWIFFSVGAKVAQARMIALSSVTKGTTAALTLMKSGVLTAGIAIKNFAMQVVLRSYVFAMNTMRLTTLLASRVLGGLKIAASVAGAALKFMFTNPVGLAASAIATLVLAGVYLYKNWDVVKAKLLSLWNSFNEKFPGMASVGKTMYDGVVSSIEGLKTEFNGIITFLQGAFSGDWSKAWDGAKTAFAGCFQALPGFAKGPLNLVISLANKAIAGLNSLGSFKIPDMIPGVGGQSVGINIPQIPMLAAGGVATGPSLAMVGEGSEPEAILPLSRLGGMMGAGGPSISVNFSPVIQITGAGNAREDVQAGLKAGAADLKRELERLMNSQRRLSYA